MTQDEIIDMARDSGMELYGLGKDRARFVHHLVAFANLVAAKEREACAKVCDDDINGFDGAFYLANKIRARGEA
jgi:hypothetical protein